MPIKRPQFKTLAARFLLIYLASLGITLAMVGGFQYIVVRQALHRQAEQAGVNIVNLLQLVLGDFPDMLNSQHLVDITKELTVLVPGLDRVSVIDPSFRIVADTDPTRIGEFTDQNALIDVMRTQVGTTFFYTRGGANFFRLHRPLMLDTNGVHTVIIGAVTIDMALAPVDVEVMQSFWVIMSILSVLLVVTALPMLALIYRGMIRPVQSLANVADRIAEGQLDVSLPPARNDEIGRLAGSFGNMVTRLTGLLAGLEERVTERTQALEASHEKLSGAYQTLQDNQQKLVLAEKMASLGRLTAGIAHEMNTPLAAVRAAMAHLKPLITEYRASAGDPEITLADHQAIAGEMLDSVLLAETAAERAAGFVRSIKAQTRDTGDQPAIRFDSARVVEDALLLLNHAVAAAGHRIGFEHSAGPIWVDGSPDRLAQVVTNLVTNALEAMPAPGGLVRLSLSRQAGEVRLEVGDTGGGIAPDILPHIFDPLFTTKGLANGTGLGLMIVHDIVTGRFGGSLEVETKVGAGTTLIVHLPTVQEKLHA